MHSCCLGRCGGGGGCTAWLRQQGTAQARGFYAGWKPGQPLPLAPSPPHAPAPAAPANCWDGARGASLGRTQSSLRACLRGAAAVWHARAVGTGDGLPAPAPCCLQARPPRHAGPACSQVERRAPRLGCDPGGGSCGGGGGRALGHSVAGRLARSWSWCERREEHGPWCGVSFSGAVDPQHVLLSNSVKGAKASSTICRHDHRFEHVPDQVMPADLVQTSLPAANW